MRLLNRTTFNYLIYSILVLFFVTPVFYFVIDRLITNEVDETLFSQKKEIQYRLQKIKSNDDLLVWSDLDGEVKIESANGKYYSDSIFNVTQYDSLTNEVEPYRVLSTTVIAGGKLYHLTARVSLVESEDLIKAIVITQAVVLVFLLAGLLLINSWVSKRIWRPFYHTLGKLENFELEKSPSLKLGSSSIKEFNDLNKSIEQLADRNYKSYLSQKEFTENAAHEMQTPLTVFQSKLELLMQTENLSEEQAALMVSLAEATARLSKLNKALLLLAKIENNQFVENEPVDVKKITNKLIAVYEKQAMAKGIEMNISIFNELEISFNPMLIDVLLSNLISNAIKYSPSGVRVEIIITGREWKIVNRGNALSISPDKIYERFQKGGTSQSSTGLGLAIVKKICDTNRIIVKNNYENNSHVFSIMF